MDPEKALSSSEITPTPAIEDRPSIKQLLEVMRIKDINITTRWRDLGLELVDSNTVQVIEANHHSDVETCCRVMFEKWLEKTPDASWSHLITALNKIEMNTAAVAISKQLKSEKKSMDNNHLAQEKDKEFVREVDPVGSGERNEPAAVSIIGTTTTTSVSFSDYDISAAFSLLTAQVSKLLKRADFYTLRRAIVQHRKVPEGVQFPDDLHKSIKAAQNLDALLDVLADSDYWSWVDLRLLEALVMSSDIEEAKILIQKYKDAIFSKKLSDILDKLPLPQRKEHKVAYTTKVGTKIDKEPNKITVGDLSYYRNILAVVIMDINSGSCVLEHLNGGCLEIHLLIPVHYRFHAYKSALNNRHKFCDIHLQYLQIEPYQPIYNPFTIHPKVLSTLLHLPKPIASTPVEVIDHYYCFLADNLDNSVICQTMLKLKVIGEKDVINSTKMSSEYRQNAFLLDLLLVTGSTSIPQFCHLLQNTKNQQQLGDMLVNAIKSIPADDVDAVTDRQSSSTPSHPTSCEEDSTDISPVCQPEVFLAAKTAHLKFLSLTTKLRQKLKTYDPKRFLATCNKLRASASNLEVISLQAYEDLDNDEVFRRPSFMWTWNDHSILRSLLEACDCQDGITMLDDFESQIDTNLPLELFPIPPPSMKMAPSLSSAFTVLSIRSEQYKDELAPLQYVNDVATIMIEKFGISSHALQLLAARANPLMLYWMILKSIVPLIIEGVNKYLDFFLKEMRFSEIAIYPNTILFAVDNLSHGSFALLSSQPQICYQCKHLKNELRHKINALEVLKKQGNDVTDQTQGQMTITEATDEDILEPLKDDSDLSDIKSTLKSEQSIIEIEELRKENEGMKIEINQLHEDLDEKNSDLRIPNLEKKISRLRKLLNSHRAKKSQSQESRIITELSPKSGDDMLLLKDLPEKFKENNLELYIDGITGLKYDEDDYTYDIKQYEGDTVVLVTFNAEADLDDIIDEISKKPFTKAGHYIKAEKIPACTSVIIKNLPPDKCDEDTLDLYFKDSGADQYKSIEILANDTAVVDFEDEQTKQNLVTMEHKLAGAIFSVTERDQCDTGNNNNSTAASTQCTVVVHGFCFTDKDEAVDCLELYFSQDKKGGEIVEDGIKIVKGKGIINFVDSKVAEQVVNNSPYLVMGQELTVVFAEEESLKQEPSNLLLKNIPPDTDIDFLELYMDSATGLSGSDGDYQLLPKPGGLYLVVFNSTLEIELSTIVKNISKKKFKKQSIEVEVISPSTSVVISNVKRNEEFLKLYFTNPKFSGVSEYENVEILDDGRVIVHLLNQESVQAVLQTKHDKLGPDIQLQVYDRFTLDEVEPNHSTRSEMPTHLTVKDEPFVPPIPIVKKVSHVMVDFVQKSNPSLSEMLEKHHVTVSINADGESEVGFIHVIPSMGSEKVKNWNEECDATIKSFFKTLSSSSLPVPSELLPKVQELVEENKSNTSLCIRFAKDYTTLHIAGDSNEVTKLVKKIKHIEEAELTTICLDAKKIAYIQAKADELREDNPDICFEINTDDTAVIVTGKKEDIGAFKQHLKQFKLCSVVVPFSEVILNYLFAIEDHTVISKLLKEQEDHCVPYFDQESKKLFVLGSERAIANRLARHLLQNINHEAIKNSSGVYEDKQFSAFCKQLKEENDVYIEILPTEIIIIGRCQHTKAIKQTLEEYIQKEYFGKRKIEVSKGRWKFISQHLHQQWDKITHKLKIDPKYEDVMTQFPSHTDDSPAIILEGEESLISVLYKEINALVESVCTNDPLMLIDRPGLFQFLITKHAELAIKGIQASIPACIEITIKALKAADETNDDNIKVTSELCKGTTKEGKQVILIKGEIENFKVDVIVNAANSQLSHGAGVALAISKKGGSKIQKDSYSYIRTHGKMMDGDAIMREEVGNLPCKRIIYAVGPTWQGGTHLEDRVLKRACIKSLRLARNFESISFPAISSGLFKFPLNVSADTIIHAFCTWSEEFPQVALRDIYVVVHDHAVQAFSDAMEKYLTMFSQQPTTNIPINLPQTSTVQIKVFAKDEKAVREAEDQLLYIIDQNCEALPVEDPRIINLKPNQTSQLAQKAGEYNVDIEVEIELSRIQLRGGKNDVQIVKAEIDRILHELDTEKLKIEADGIAAYLLRKKIKWQYQVDDEQFEDYDPQVNYQIEQAYQLYKAKKHRPLFAFKDQDTHLKIIFNRNPMQEKDCTNGGLLTNVQRIDIEDKILKKDEFPSTWGKGDKNPQTKVILLDPWSWEYIDVKKGFDSTIGGTKKTIVKIERVQNPTLYTQYAARKKFMDQTNPPGTVNERRLYHGCGGDVIQHIIHGGFNRSFAEKCATVHGAGVYFAVNASCSSSTYSPPDANGNKHIFLALVLTGEYTVGNSSLRVPPAKDPNQSAVILYDSVVDNVSNPNTFVIFYDAQSYPEYLITFK